jgi:hypothetical protein
MIPPQPVSVTCPQCNQPFTVELHSIIDVGIQPELKQRLLNGELNVARCPRCGAVGAIGTPILYHDPDKELAYVLVPTELNLPREEQERLIGTLTNALMDALPPERRKGYLLQPKTFLSMDSLLRAILEADGITQEMLEAQEKRLRLINELEGLLSDEEAFERFVEERRDEFDYEFFLLLSALIERAGQAGSKAEMKRLEEVRRRVVELTSPPEGPIPVPLETFDDLLNLLRQARDDGQLKELVAVNRAVFDYIFFQQLAERIEAAAGRGDKDRAAELTQLRDDILQATEAVDRATEEALQRGAQLLQEILQSEDPEKTASERLDEVDQAFLLVLSANIAHAREQRQDEIADRLEALYNHIMARLEEQLPPHLRLVNRLLRAESADERAALLDEAGELVNDELAALLRNLAQDARLEGQQALAEQFQTLLQEVEARLKSS